MDLTFALLLIEPSRYHARLIERTLHQRCPEGRIVTVETVQQGLTELTVRTYDIAIAAAEMEGYDGLEVLQLIRRESAELPVILLAAHQCEQAASEAIRYGAYDFLSKDETYHLMLPRVIQESLRRSSLIRKNRELEDRLRTDEHSDAVALVLARLEHEINNPLMTILGATDLLLQHSALLNSDTRDKLALIEKSARRIQQAIGGHSQHDEMSLVNTAGGLMLEPNTRPSRT